MNDDDSSRPPPLLDVRDLSIAFAQAAARRRSPSTSVSFSLERGRTLALVGESGSGKSITALSIVRLLPPSAVHPSGSIDFAGDDILKLSDARLRAIRGAKITMVFQEPMTSLNPLQTIEQQIGEILELHGARGADKIRARVDRIARRGRHSRTRPSASPLIRINCRAASASA